MDEIRLSIEPVTKVLRIQRPRCGHGIPLLERGVEPVNQVRAALVTRPAHASSRLINVSATFSATLWAPAASPTRMFHMGTFIYEGSVKTEMEDRTLAHVQVVMTAKLRRREPFAFTWKDNNSIGGGRTTVWVQTDSCLVFTYRDGTRMPLNPEWVDALASTANAPTGLYLVPEPPTTPVHRSAVTERPHHTNSPVTLPTALTAVRPSAPCGDPGHRRDIR